MISIFWFLISSTRRLRFSQVEPSSNRQRVARHNVANIMTCLAGRLTKMLRRTFLTDLFLLFNLDRNSGGRLGFDPDLLSRLVATRVGTG